MLTKADDFPIHQTPEPVAYAGTDRNFYDRYFFNGYSPDGATYFAVAFGVYPHLNVADAHFAVIRDGVEHCLHASKILHSERLDLTVGPITIEVVEPLQVLKVKVNGEGLEAEITFTGRAFPIEEPRFIRRMGPRAFMDYTRLTQNVRCEGWIAVDGDPAFAADVLGQARIVHEGPRPHAPDEARLLDGEGAAGEGDLGFEPLAVHLHLQHLQRLDHLDGDGTDGQIQALRMQDLRGVQAVFDPVADHGEMGVGHVQVRIDAERHGEIGRAVGAVAVEEVAVVEVPVRPRIGHRLRRLMDGKVVGLGQHGRPPDGSLVLGRSIVGIATPRSAAVSSEPR